MEKLLHDIRACRLCDGLPLGPRPILQASATARILIAGQAPGRITHAKGRPFDDVSGERLRQWLGLTHDQFYDARKVALVPMGFCYPGKGKGGDLPPRPLCAETWRVKVLAEMPEIKLTLLLGQYAQRWHGVGDGDSLQERARNFRPRDKVFSLPHPSPRNQGWMKKNPWFEKEVLPMLRERVKRTLQ